MAEKISKTARASMRAKDKESAKHQVIPCPLCETAMTATKVIQKPRGMHWICSKCGYRERIHPLRTK